MSSVRFPDIKVKLIGENGNIYNLMGIVGRALRENDKAEFVDEFNNDITSSQSYDEALCKIMSWVNVE